MARLLFIILQNIFIPYFPFSIMHYMFCMMKGQSDLLFKNLGKFSNVSEFSHFSYIINDPERLIHRKKYMLVFL